MILLLLLMKKLLLFVAMLLLQVVRILNLPDLGEIRISICSSRTERLRLLPLSYLLRKANKLLLMKAYIRVMLISTTFTSIRSFTTILSFFSETCEKAHLICLSSWKNNRIIEECLYWKTKMKNILGNIVKCFHEVIHHKGRDKFLLKFNME